jgi:excinuclease UvrABC ATPase subunit
MEGNDKAALAALGGAEAIFSDRFACPICSFSISELEPRLFSFNNPAGACAACDGLGVKQFFDDHWCEPRPRWRAARSGAGIGATPTTSDDPGLAPLRSTRAVLSLPEPEHPAPRQW